MWWNLLIAVAFNFVAMMLAPKQQPPKAGTLEDLSIPITKEGTEFGKVYGCRWLDSPLIHWYGDYKTIAITKKGGK